MGLKLDSGFRRCVTQIRDLLRFGGVTFGLGAGLVLTVVSIAVAGPFLSPHDPLEVVLARRFAPPSAEFVLGTDHLGRDIFSRLLHGARLSLTSTLLAMLLITSIGVSVGAIAGYLGGLVDIVVSRIIDVFLSFPGFLLAMALVGALGPSLISVLVAIISVSWAGFARVMRAQVIVEMRKLYVDSLLTAGAGSVRVAWQIVKNTGGPIVVLATLESGTILLGISGLSFLGLGVSPPAPEWGAMLSESRDHIGQAPLMMVAPGASIFVAVLGFNLLADAMRDLLDPGTRGKLHRWL